MTRIHSSPLIISGAPRSGTSLLYNLFDGHSEVSWLVDEGFLFEYLDDLGADAADVFLDAVPAQIDALIAGLRDKQVMPPTHLPYQQSKERGSMSEVTIESTWDEEAFRCALAGAREGDVASFWQRLVSAWLAGMGEPLKRYACMKSPDYGKSASGALATITETRAIVIIRDPFYAIDSLKRSRELRGEKLLTWPLIAQNIRNFDRMGERVATSDPGRLRVIRYEDLVSSPETTMRGLAEWLEIAFEPCLLAPTMHGKHWPGISSFNPTDGIEARPAQREIGALTCEEQELIQKHLRTFRSAYGYA